MYVRTYYNYLKIKPIFGICNTINTFIPEKNYIKCENSLIFFQFGKEKSKQTKNHGFVLIPTIHTILTN